MIRLRMIAIVVVFACGLSFWPGAASAAGFGQLELKLNYWPAMSSWSFNNGNTGGWNTQFWGGDLRWTSNAGWGVHLKYDAGSESAWNGYWSSVISTSSGTDTVWSGDVFYALHIAGATVRPFVGYGHIEFNNVDPFFGNVDLTATGYRVGADVAIPLVGGFSLNANAAWYPNNSEAFRDRLTSSSGSGTALEGGASIQYTWPAGWLVEAGYRWMHSDTSALGGTACPCVLQSNGPVFSVGYRW